MYVVVARYYAKEGSEDDVIRHLLRVVGPSRDEPGCQAYFVNQDLEDPRRILIYEGYSNEAAFHLHFDSPHVQEIIVGTVWPLLDHRERLLYSGIEPTGKSRGDST